MPAAAALLKARTASGRPRTCGALPSATALPARTAPTSSATCRPRVSASRTARWSNFLRPRRHQKNHEAFAEEPGRRLQRRAQAVARRPASGECWRRRERNSRPGCRQVDPGPRVAGSRARNIRLAYSREPSRLRYRRCQAQPASLSLTAQASGDLAGGGTYGCGGSRITLIFAGSTCRNTG
jgi:hypothetical protein